MQYPAHQGIESTCFSIFVSEKSLREDRGGH
jgi:hypothetical protein